MEKVAVAVDTSIAPVAVDTSVAPIDECFHACFVLVDKYIDTSMVLNVLNNCKLNPDQCATCKKEIDEFIEMSDHVLNKCNLNADQRAICMEMIAEFKKKIQQMKRD